MGDLLTKLDAPASGKRSSAEDILSDMNHLAQDQLLLDLLDAIPVMTAILDTNRQVVCANRKLIETFGSGNIEVLLGLRPGELMRCSHAWDNPLGCGTGPNCRYCGAAGAGLTAQRSHTDSRECRIVTESGEAYELKVSATPFDHEGETFTILAIEDIADRRRREVLERAFFHDVLNTAGNIRGVVNLAKDAETTEETRELTTLAGELTDGLIEEIQAHRDILGAEKSDLELSLHDMGVTGFMKSLLARTRHLDCAMGKKITLDLPEVDHAIRADKNLLNRVLVNLVKNALEASQRGQTVTVGFRHVGDVTSFRVHNSGSMSEEVRLQIFQRSFSTKGRGRGLGTYSAKLLTERYLQGRIEFTSNVDAATAFHLTIPDFPDPYHLTRTRVRTLSTPAPRSRAW